MQKIVNLCLCKYNLIMYILFRIHVVDSLATVSCEFAFSRWFSQRNYSLKFSIHNISFQTYYLRTDSFLNLTHTAKKNKSFRYTACLCSIETFLLLNEECNKDINISHHTIHAKVFPWQNVVLFNKVNVQYLSINTTGFRKFHKLAQRNIQPKQKKCH